jgi:hypothetical protein
MLNNPAEGGRYNTPPLWGRNLGPGLALGFIPVIDFIDFLRVFTNYY